MISSCPSTWNRDEDFNLSKAINAELGGGNQHRSLIGSAEDMLHLILRVSFNFCKRKGPAGFNFEECFRSSINSVSEQQNRLFQEFCGITKQLEDESLSPQNRKKQLELLLRLDKETELVVEIMDIQDELTIIKTIMEQQRAVLQDLQRMYPKRRKAYDDSDGERDSRTLPRGEASAPGPGQRRAKGKGTSVEPETPIPPAGQGKTRPRKPRELLQNLDLMHETVGIVEIHIRIVANMLDMAQKVQDMVGIDRCDECASICSQSDQLQNLLDLKQKHANGWEARFSREGSEETQRQGNVRVAFSCVEAGIDRWRRSFSSSRLSQPYL